MKIKVKNEEHPLFGEILKMENINFDMVIVKKEYAKVALKMEDVELIAENKYEEIISKYKDILKIKLQDEISPIFYPTLISCIEAEMEGKIKCLEVVKDEFEISKRGRWDKRLIIVVNKKNPIEVSVNAMRYSKEFSITFKDINMSAFIEVCKQDLKAIKKEIEDKEKNLERYKNALKEIFSVTMSTEESSYNKLISV